MLDKKLILEDVFDERGLEEPTTEKEDNALTPEEETSFHIGTISDLLNRYLELFSTLKAIAADEALDEGVKNVWESVSEDTAIAIGKLQGCLPLCANEKEGDLIAQGEEEAQKEIAPTEE